MLWPSPLEVDFGVFCQRAGEQGSSSSASVRGAGRAHRDVRLERNQDLNSKTLEQLLPKRKLLCVRKGVEPAAVFLHVQPVLWVVPVPAEPV